MAFAHEVQSRGTGIAAQIGALIETLRQAWKLRQLRRTTYNELSRLSDRELADLGLHRSQIASVAREAARTV